MTVCCAYTGRIAVAYRVGEPFQRKKKKAEPNSRFCNLYVAIYECESTGNVNPLVMNGFSHPYHLDLSTFTFRGIRSNFSFLFHFSKKHL